MCKPIEKYENHARGAVSEILSAMSALNMEPDPNPDAPEGAYLSESDRWAKHAMEHLRAAIREANLADMEQEKLKWMLHLTAGGDNETSSVR